MKPKALVLQAHGSNRDFDVIEALVLAGAEPIGIPLNDLRSNKSLLSKFQLLVIPGGFSYADALGAGRLLALDLASYFAEDVLQFVDSGKPVIGICNGFQALVKSGVLPGSDVVARRVAVPTKQSPVKRDTSENKEIASGYTCTRFAKQIVRRKCRPRNNMPVTLTFNARGHFECRWVTLKPVSQNCLWTKGLEEYIECPIAHGEGNFQTSEFFPLSSFVKNDQIVLTYIHPNGSQAHGEYPSNPNGSIHDIAGICNPQGNVLGLMPHPENHIHTWQHPLHTRGKTQGSGLKLFENGVNYAKQI